MSDGGENGPPRHIRLGWARFPWLQGEVRRKQLRYVASSAVSVAVGQIALAITFGALKWSAVSANIASFIGAGLVAYQLHRRWTWRKTGRSRALSELFPYWLILLAGLALSTLAVDVVAREGSKLTDRRVVVTGLVMLAALAVNGAIWVVKYQVFDRHLFVSQGREGSGPA